MSRAEIHPSVLTRHRYALVAVAAVTGARIVYSVWWSPYELVADEAQYWDWSRHLEWSYYSKGPGVAWLIAAATFVLGSAEWAVRLPAALSFACVMLAMAWLTADALGDDPAAVRATVFVPVLIALIPAYQLYGLLMTTDPPALACWALALTAAWRVYRLEATGRPQWVPWLSLGAAIGLGFLFKYTDVLLVPGLLAFMWITRAEVSWGGAWKRALAGALVALVLSLPVVVWNARHGAAAAGHVLAYVAAPGGDVVGSGDGGWSWVTVLEFPVVQAAVIGPILGLALVGVRRRRSRVASSEAHLARLLICAAAPFLMVCLLASTRTRIEGNWPMAVFLSVVPFAAIAVARGLAPRWWAATLAYGMAALVVIHAPLTVAALPEVGHFVPVHRFHGARERISAVGGSVTGFLERSAGRGIVVAPNHRAAGLLAYYLPGQPTVVSAGSQLGDRRSAYDFFTVTNLSGADMVGRPALFVGGYPDLWRTLCDCPDLALLDSDGPLFVTAAFTPANTLQSK